MKLCQWRSLVFIISTLGLVYSNKIILWSLHEQENQWQVQPEVGLPHGSRGLSTSLCSSPSIEVSPIFLQLLLHFFGNNSNKKEEAKVLYTCYTNEVNPFHTTGFFWYPLKASENLWFFDVFKRYRNRPVTWNGLINATITFSSLFSIMTLALEQFNTTYNAA